MMIEPIILFVKPSQIMLRFTANLSLLFTEYSLENRFKVAKECGFNAVEIQFPYSYPATHIQQLLSDNQLELVLFNIDADDLLSGGEGLAAVPEKQALFQHALQQCKTYAEILKPLAINVLPGRCLDLTRKAEYLTTFKQNLASTLNVLSPLGIKTVFEAINTIDMPGFIIHSGQQMLNVIKELNNPDLLMQYDIYHMQMMGEDIEQFIQLHASQIGHIQFADVPGRGEPGSGEIDFETLFKIIDQSNYTGWLGAEYKPTGKSKNSTRWLHNI